MKFKSRAQLCISYGQINFAYGLRIFWRGIATWTREYLMSRHTGLGMYEHTFNRLYAMPQEAGNIMQYIFGYDVAQRFIQLLSQHVIRMRGLIDAQLAGNNEMANQELQALYRNADEIAGFLTLNNPFWDETQLRNHGYTLIALTVEEITTIQTGAYERNIDVYDRILRHADTMGTYAAYGVFSYMSYYSQNAGNTVTQRNASP